MTEVRKMMNVFYEPSSCLNWDDPVSDDIVFFKQQTLLKQQYVTSPYYTLKKYDKL